MYKDLLRLSSATALPSTNRRKKHLLSWVYKTRHSSHRLMPCDSASRTTWKILIALLATSKKFRTFSNLKSLTPDQIQLCSSPACTELLSHNQSLTADCLFLSSSFFLSFFVSINLTISTVIPTNLLLLVWQGACQNSFSSKSVLQFLLPPTSLPTNSPNWSIIPWLWALSKITSYYSLLLLCVGWTHWSAILRSKTKHQRPNSQPLSLC